MSDDFLDRDGPDGKRVGRAEDRAMMAVMHQLMPDLTVEVKDALTEGDKVVVRNLWTGTNAKTGSAWNFTASSCGASPAARSSNAGPPSRRCTNSPHSRWIGNPPPALFFFHVSFPPS